MKEKLESNWIYLSYPLNSETISYGGQYGFKVASEKQMTSGDSCNTSTWSLSSHTGTHIDFPKHFSPNGSAIEDFAPSFFVLDSVYTIDISPIKPGMIIDPQKLILSEAPENTELLVIKTGFGAFRQHPVYWQKNPGFNPDVAPYLRRKFPLLRIMGFDCISLSSFANRELGRMAHRAFLDNEMPILPLEDMDLRGIGKENKINRVIAAPMLVEGTDGAPCTVLAEVI